MSKIISGFSLVSQEEKDAFLRSPEGQELREKIEADYFQAPIGMHSNGFTVNLKNAFFSDKKIAFRQKIQNTDSFLRLKQAIVCEQLKRHFFEYQFLDEEAQKTLACANYSVALYDAGFSEESFKAWTLAYHRDQNEYITNIRAQLHQKISQFLARARTQIGFLFPTQSEAQLFSLAQEIYSLAPTMADKASLLEHHLESSLRRHNMWLERDNQRRPLHLWLVDGALSFLVNNVVTANVSEYMSRIADAHTFYQFLGLSTENGGWELDYLDLYNYARNQESIATAKNVLYVLMRPLHAFFHEYVQIARYEKNMLNIILRAMIPIIVVGIFLVFSFSIVMPFAIHELLEIFMLIPALYLALSAASGYVLLKNQLFFASMEFWWGSVYQMPAFQVNDRMLISFNDDRERAQSIANYYIERLKEVDQIERDFAKIAIGCLTEAQLESRKANMTMKSTLLLEWYDIHSNHTLGSDKAPSIVANRLFLDGKAEYEELRHVSERFVDDFLVDLEEHRQTVIYQPQEPINRASSLLFFSPSAPVEALGQECARHREKIDCIERIYPAVCSI